MLQLARCCAVVGCVLALGSCASSQDDVKALVAMTPEHFRDTAAITDDELETTAVISMEPGFKQTIFVWDTGWECNSFLRAFVDKRTLKVNYQLYVVVGYVGSQWRFYDTINYKTAAGVESAPVTLITRDVPTCTSQGCLYKETVGFDMSEQMIRQIAASYTPSAGNPWLFKLKGKIIGADQEDGIMPAEAAGLLEAAAVYTGSRHH
jgi:hypothetical protein